MSLLPQALCLCCSPCNRCRGMRILQLIETWPLRIPESSKDERPRWYRLATLPSVIQSSLISCSLSMSKSMSVSMPPSRSHAVGSKRS